MNHIRRVLLLAALVLYVVAVFIVDSIAPIGIEVWVLNVPVIVVLVLFRNIRMVVIVSLACSLMTLIGGLLSPLGNNPRSWDYINRGMGLMTMWLITIMVCGIIKKSIQLEEAITGLQKEMALHDQTRRELELSEERLRLAVEGAGMGTFDVNLQTGKVIWSASHLQMLGYALISGGQTTADMWWSCVHPDDQARILEAREQALLNRSIYSAEYRINRADNGEIAWLAVFGRFHYDQTGEAIRFLGVTFDIGRRKELESEVLKISDREQQLIGQELHDDVGQMLTGLSLMAQTLTQRLPETATEKPIALRVAAGLNQLHQKVRALAGGLVPVELESNGLCAALEDLAASTREQSGVSVKFDCPEMVEMPDHTASLQLYRIAQEAVCNALRHGRPQEIRLTMLLQPNGLRLRIKDDGVGLQDHPPERKGMGIRIMEYRAGLIGGVVRIEPAARGGTVVTCMLPRRKVHDDAEFRTGAEFVQNLDRG